MPLELHVGDVGIPFDVVPLKDDGVSRHDFSGMDLIEYRLQKPDGVLLALEGHFVSDADGGYCRYVFADGDLDQSGTWRFQLRVVDDAGELVYFSPIAKLKVFPNLPLEI